MQYIISQVRLTTKIIVIAVPQHYKLCHIYKDTLGRSIKYFPVHAHLLIIPLWRGCGKRRTQHSLRVVSSRAAGRFLYGCDIDWVCILALVVILDRALHSQFGVIPVWKIRVVIPWQSTCLIGWKLCNHDWSTKHSMNPILTFWLMFSWLINSWHRSISWSTASKWFFSPSRREGCKKLAIVHEHHYPSLNSFPLQLSQETGLNNQYY